MLLQTETLLVIYLGALQALWVLLPLIPAILIFKLFHDTAVKITGQLLGLTISAGGAFAGYLVVLLVTQSWSEKSQELVRSWNPPPHWEVTAEIKLLDSNQKPVADSAAMKEIMVYT